MVRNTILRRRHTMEIHYPEIGVCGLSCRLCPMHATDAASRCDGCKSPARIAVGCPFITCAVKRKEIEFCWACEESTRCEKWAKHREAGKSRDSFKCYQTLEEDIAFIGKNGIQEFDRIQKEREKVLEQMLSGYNEGRSKSYYCIAATVLDREELREALAQAQRESGGMTAKERSKRFHAIIDALAATKEHHLKLRK